MIERFTPRILVLISAVGLAACGSGDGAASSPAGSATSAGDETSAGDQASTGDEASAEAGGAAAAAEAPGGGDGIMLASKLDPGVIEVEVDGEVYEFRRDDPEQADFECAVSDERVQLAFQSGTNDHAMLLEYSDASLIGGPDGRFSGRATIEPRELESGFYGAEQFEVDAAFVDRESPYAFVVLDAGYAESRSDLEYDSVGTMIIRANCEDG